MDKNIAEISVPNFKIFGLDHDCHGGGVFIYCSEDISCFDHSHLNSAEFVGKSIKTKTSMKDLGIIISNDENFKEPMMRMKAKVREVMLTLWKSVIPHCGHPKDKSYLPDEERGTKYYIWYILEGFVPNFGHLENVSK